MSKCPLYNSQNLVFTGNKNPYELIQNAGKKSLRKRLRRTIRKNGKRSRKTRKTRN
jgi:hypothetical protein